MKQNILTFLCSLLLVGNVFAQTKSVDNEYESLSRQQKLTNMKVNISNANMALMNNAVAMDDLKQKKGQYNSSIVALTDEIVFVTTGSIIKKLKVGDRYEKSTIKSILNDRIVLSNGKTIHVF